MGRNHPPVASHAPGDGLRNAWLPARGREMPAPVAGTNPRPAAPTTAWGAHRRAAGRRGHHDLPPRLAWRSPVSESSGEYRQAPPRAARTTATTPTASAPPAAFSGGRADGASERGRPCPLGQPRAALSGRRSCGVLGAKAPGRMVPGWLVGCGGSGRAGTPWSYPGASPRQAASPPRGFSPARGLATRGRHRERSPRRARPRRNRTAARCATAEKRKPRHGRPPGCRRPATRSRPGRRVVNSLATWPHNR
jgi:hypothetical protein